MRTSAPIMTQQQPPMTTHTTLDRMHTTIGAWEQAGDRRTIFLKCYALMTSNMLLAIEQGRFRDPQWVERLVHHFAEYYFVALEAYEAHSLELPDVWRLAFDQAREPTTTAVQSLLMGVNAHINYDLVFALADVLQDEWDTLTPEQREARYQDHCTVNEVIGETVDAVQDQVVESYARAMNLVDVLLGPLDEWWTARLIRNWRADVWRHTAAWLVCPDSDERDLMRRQIDALALGRIRLLLEGGELGARVFGYPLRWLHKLRLL